MNKEQIDEIAFKVARESNLRLDNACRCSTCRERYDPPRIKAFVHALLAELVKEQEPAAWIHTFQDSGEALSWYGDSSDLASRKDWVSKTPVFTHPLPRPDLVAEIEAAYKAGYSAGYDACLEEQEE